MKSKLNYKTISLSIIITGVLIVVSCKSKQKSSGGGYGGASNKVSTLNMPGDKELAEAKKTWGDVTIDELKKGQAIFYNECTSCHQPYDIVGFSEKKWKHEIDDMSPKAELTAAQKDQLTKYILSFRSANAVAGK